MNKLTVFCLLSVLLFNIPLFLSQQIDFTNKINEVVSITGARQYANYDDGLIGLDEFEIMLINFKNNTVTKKPWTKFTTTVANFKSTGNSIARYFALIDNQIHVAIEIQGLKTKKLSLMILNFDLSLVSEKLLVEIPVYKGSDKQEIAFTFYKSPRTENYVAAYSVQFKPGVKKGDQIECFIFDMNFNLLKHLKADLPKPETTDNYRVYKNVQSIFTLEDGSALMNFDGTLYFLTEVKALPVRLNLDHDINSYVILNKSVDEIIVVGSYASQNDKKNPTKKSSGLTIITLDKETMEQIATEYVELDQKFDLDPFELFKSQSTGASPEESFNYCKPRILNARISNGLIQVVVVGISAKKMDNSFNNIDFIGMNFEGEIITEHLETKYYPSTMDLNATFKDDRAVVFAYEYSMNFDATGNFKNKLMKEPDTYDANEVERQIITFNYSTTKITNKKISVATGGLNTHYNPETMELSYITASFPQEKQYVVTNNYPANNKNLFVKEKYTMIGELDY